MCTDRHDVETEADLVKGLQRGDMSAFDELFARHRRGILAYTFGLIGDRGLAEDIVQESFVELTRRIRSIDPRRGCKAWLYRVARNRAVDMMRRRKSEVLPGDDFFADESKQAAGDVFDTPAGRMMEKEEQQRLRRALNRLPGWERDLLLLRFYGDLTFVEIARVLKRPLGTVLWKAGRCLAKLKGFLATPGE